MNQCGKIMKAVVMGISLLVGLSAVANNAIGAIAPVVSNMTPVNEGASTPVRILADSTGNYFVSDPRGGGVLKYSRNGKLLNVFTAVHDAVGLALAQNGELLVTHGTTVVRLDPVTGNIIQPSFGTFGKANGIAVDGAGNVYVTDSVNDCVQKFDSNYAPVLIATHDVNRPTNSFGITGLSTTNPPQFKRPAGITFEKASGQLAVADSLNGRIVFLSTSGVLTSTMGTFGSGSVATSLKFTMPKGIAFEYAGSVVSRYYVADSFQSNIQVIDAATKTFLGYIGSYGYGQGNLVSPTDVEIDQSNPLAPVLVVANEIGILTRYGIDSLLPTDVQVLKATKPGELTLSWTNPSIPTFNYVNVYQSSTPGTLGTLVGTNITGTSLTVTGLIADATYYYTVRGVNSSLAETSNTDQVYGTTLSSEALFVALTGTGNGSVSSDLPLPGLIYSNGTYTASVNSGTKVTLTPVHSADSIFTGWTGTVCNNQPSGACVFTIVSPVNVAANFDLQHKFKLAGKAVYDDILQNIYAQAVSGDTIMAMAGTAPAFDVNQYVDMTAKGGITVTVEGGYDPEYLTTSTFTTITGRVNINSGKVVFKGIKIK